MIRPNDENQSKIKEIIRKHSEELLRKRNVVGVAYGEKVIDGKRTGRSSLLIYVKQKLESLLREEDKIDPVIDGVETDVIESGEITLQQNNFRLRPVVNGISVSDVSIVPLTLSRGTLGCLLQNELDGRLYILSNNHLIANSNLGRLGDPIIQPGTLDGGLIGLDQIGSLFRFPRTNSGGVINTVDCALGAPMATINMDRLVLDLWSDVRSVPGWFGDESQGGGIAIADIDGDGRPDLVVFHIDNPSGGNAGWYRIAFDIMRDGNLARWTIAT